MILALPAPLETLHPEVLEDLCRHWQVRELSFFGSVLRDDFGPGSDIDVLIDFESTAPWTLFEFARLRNELSELFGRPVDLVERAALTDRPSHERILATRRQVYAA